MAPTNLILNMRNISVIFSLVCWLLCSLLCSGGDTLTSGQKISEDSEKLISATNKFELGFFSLPIESGRKYLGIWYHNLEPQTVVWVANRDKPIVNSTGVFQIAENGNIVVADASKKPYWSSNLLGSSSTNVTVKLMDSGNLVVMKDDGSYMWQSFQYPTDTFLPGMKMDTKLKLTCWKNSNDSGSGSFTFEQPQKGSYIVKNDSQLYWAPNNGYNLQGIYPTLLRMLDNTTLETNSTFHNSSSYKMKINDKSRVLMNFTGELQFWKWNEDIQQWFKQWGRPSDICDTHNYCGTFSSCNVNNWKPCKCLPGFSQRLSDISRGYLRQRFQGCFRKSTLCGAIANNDIMFLNLTNIKVGNPDKGFLTETEEQCQSKCLDMCSQGHSQCQAYSFNLSTTNRDRSSFACQIWTQDLPTLREEQDDGRHLSIPVKRSEIAPTTRSCDPCGTYVIPYPLSTGPNCGDPMYNKFNCDMTGKVSFMMPDGKSYRVTWIDEGDKKFYIQTDDLVDHCGSSSSYQNDNPSFPFNVTNWCFKSDEIELNWAPASEPLCDKYIGCRNWSHSTCSAKSGGEMRCLCMSNYQWNASSLSCTQELSTKHSTRKLPLILAVIFIVILIILTCTMVYAYVRRKKIAHKLDTINIQIQESLDDSERQVKGLIGLESLEENNNEGVDIPYYTLRSIVEATDNFSDSNKLGRGGYGPVYKGTFPGGQYIAVKRLSSVSTQGLQEFKNEVVVIAKLQHRNLVRLRGYCIKGDEKILIYEYMPNKSLDSFVFDRTRTVLLDWQLRFDIILGIARGMLYLHQDSRLRVIHRDLKTSNILLDEEMIPKISDFGLAKIFGGKETEANTERVVGTYGYMAPEYALDGFFSIKSDVFSFGVVLLEILSGKRNTGFYQSKQISSLLGYAWRLWTENKLLELMDPAFCESCNQDQFIKCALIGLLCVQDEPGDRPTMSNVVTMLDSEIATIPIPTQPTFFMTKRQSSSASSSSKPEISIESSYQEGR